MESENQDQITTKRIYFLDNLRTFMIFLVVLYHAGLVYESSGSIAFFWIVDDPSTNDLVGILNILLDIFIMTVIFFISGFLTPLSLKNKTSWIFIKNKFRRLIIPWIAGVLILIPLYKVIYLYSRELPQESWVTYFHFSNEIFSQSWLWFLPVLFLFDLIYLLITKLKISIPDVTLKKAILMVFCIGFFYTFGLSVFNLQGWTKTILLDFQNERLLVYFAFFLLGAFCYKLQVFDSENKKFFVFISIILWIPLISYLLLVLNPIVNPGKVIFSEMLDQIFIQFSFHFSLLSLLYLLLTFFRYYFNRQGKVLKMLNENSYNVYIIHMIVMGIIATLLLDVSISSLLKFILLTTSTYLASNLIVYIYRKIVRLKASLK